MRGWSDALRLAAQQHGAITWLQLLNAGVAETTACRLVVTGALRGFAPGTYIVAGSPRTWNQKVMASVLAVGPEAAASHRAAAVLLELLEQKPSQIHVTAPFGRHDGKLSSYVAHRARTLTAKDVRTVDGIRVTCVERTLVDLAGTSPVKTLARAVDTALLANRTTIDACLSYIDDRNLRCRKGAGRLTWLLEDRRTGIPESELEREFLELVDRFGLPRPERQEIAGPYRIDFFYPDQSVVVEVNGRATHGTPQAFEDDHERRNELSLRGYRHMLGFTWQQVTRRATYVASTLSNALSVPRA